MIFLLQLFSLLYRRYGKVLCEINRETAWRRTTTLNEMKQRAHERNFFPIANNRIYLLFMGIDGLFLDLRLDQPTNITQEMLQRTASSKRDIKIIEC